jgi:hypothetical protein
VFLGACAAAGFLGCFVLFVFLPLLCCSVSCEAACVLFVFLVLVHNDGTTCTLFNIFCLFKKKRKELFKIIYKIFIFIFLKNKIGLSWCGLSRSAHACNKADHVQQSRPYGAHALKRT